MNISPGQAPKVGDRVSVEHDGEWQEAEITAVVGDRIQGTLLETRIPTSFSYTISSYRRNWRWSQMPP